MNCPHCQTQNPRGARFCLSCGAALTQRCPHCQMELPTGARFCMNCGQSLVVRTPADDDRLTRLAAAAPTNLVRKVRAAARLAGERRMVTALFVDVVGSTALARQVDAKAWSTIMNGAFDRCHPAIYRYEGTIARLLGDELLAFFGAPVAHEDDPLRAVHAAFDLLSAMAKYAQDVRREYDVDFAVRVSLSTGPVIVGPIGGDLKYEYSALGGGVNLAAQVELLKRSMAVLISGETYPFVAPFFECVALESVSGPDRPSAVRVYEVRGPKATPVSERGLVDLESPLVGRDVELATLTQLSGTVRAGMGRAVLIVGDPGVGKSRLVAEWCTADESRSTVAASVAALQWVEGRCLSYSRELAYHLLIDLLRSLINGSTGVPAGADEPQTRAALDALIQDLFGPAKPRMPKDTSVPPIDRAMENGELDVYAALGHLLSLQLEDRALERVQSLTPEALRALYLAALRRLFQALAARRPLALVLENLHWADPSSIDLLIHLLPLTSRAPVLLVLVTRPDRDAPGWQLVVAAREILGSALAELPLSTLSSLHSRQLISNLLGQQAVPDSIQIPILQKAEGNPLFVQEVIRMLIDRGAIQQAGENWIIRQKIDGTEIPDNLQRLLMARIDRLPDDIEYTLRVASVIGRRFPVQVLEQVLGREENRSDLVSHLSQLESAGLIRVDQISPELTYRFQNVLVQDAAYASLLATDLQRLHLAVAQALESIYPKRLAARELAPTLATHFDRGGEPFKALAYFTLAGDAALVSYANQEAQEHYRRALELASRCTLEQDRERPPEDTRKHADHDDLLEEPKRADLLFGLGEALYRQSRYKDAIETWHSGIELYQVSGHHDGVARLYARSARAAWYDGDPQQGRALCQEGLAAVAGAPESPGMAILIHEAARSLYFTGAPLDQARELGQQAFEMAERLQVVSVQADALATLGLLPDQEPWKAVETLHLAVELAESAGLLAQARRAHNNLAALLQERASDFHAALKHYQRAAELSRQTGSVEGEIIALSNMASAAWWTGDLSRAEQTFEQRRQLFSEAANPALAAAGLRISEALLLRYRGELGQAAELLQECQLEARRQESSQHLLQCVLSWADLQIEIGMSADGQKAVEWGQVQAILQEAVETSDLIWAGERVWARCLLAAVRACQGRFKEAHYVLAEAREVAGSGPIPLDEAWLSWGEARVAVAERRWAEALAAFESAARLCGRLGIRWWWARALQEWAEAHVARGEPADLERARALFREAQVLFEELHTTHYARLMETRLQAVNAAIHAEMLARHEVAQELAVASQIQESFLPKEPPRLDGWQLAVALRSARETSGDFYDFIPLPNGRWGLLVADVADKGVGAALYMALCRTLMRTYASEFGMQPELTLSAVNGRILAETRSSMFVTMFYAVLDPLAHSDSTATLTYCSAGHPPSLLFRIHRGLSNTVDTQALRRTGMAMGVVRDATWAQGTVQMTSGDILVLYSDGVTEAHSKEQELFGEARLIQAVEAKILEWANAVGPSIQSLSAQEILDSLLAELQAFVGDAPQSDDITLMVLMNTR